MEIEAENRANPLSMTELIENVMFGLLDAGPAMLNFGVVSKLHHRVVHSASAWIRYGFSDIAPSGTHPLSDDYLSGQEIASILGIRRIIKLKQELEVLEHKFRSEIASDYLDLYPSNINYDTGEVLVQICDYAFGVVTVHELADIICLTKEQLKRHPALATISRRIVLTSHCREEDRWKSLSTMCTIERPYEEDDYIVEATAKDPGWYFQAMVYKNFTQNGKKSMTYINTNVECNSFGLDRILYFFIYNHESYTIELCGVLQDYMKENHLNYEQSEKQLYELLHELDDARSDDDDMAFIQISRFDDGYAGPTIRGKKKPLVLRDLKLFK
jgi:hypothetical protein